MKFADGAVRFFVQPSEKAVFLSGQAGSDKDALINELESVIRNRAGELGLEVVSVGIREVILTVHDINRRDLVAGMGAGDLKELAQWVGRSQCPQE